MMSQTCTICRHERRDAIDRALLDGESFRSISRRTGTSTTALHRHKGQHIPRMLVLSKAAGDELHAGTLTERIRAINRETLEILREARASRNPVIALAAISRVERQIELEARLSVETGKERENLPDCSHYTTEQLYFEREVLQEARAKIEARYVGRKAPAGLLEAGDGTVAEIGG
jgi:hypothetical protein